MKVIVIVIFCTIAYITDACSGPETAEELASKKCSSDYDIVFVGHKVSGSSSTFGDGFLDTYRRDIFGVDEAFKGPIRSGTVVEVVAIINQATGCPVEIYPTGQALIYAKHRSHGRYEVIQCSCNPSPDLVDLDALRAVDCGDTDANGPAL